MKVGDFFKKFTPNNDSNIVSKMLTQLNANNTAMSNAEYKSPIIEEGELVSDVVDGDKVTTESNNSQNIKDVSNVVDSNKVAANVVDSNKVAANVVDSNKVAANVVDSNKVAANVVDSNKVAANVVDSNKVAANVVDSNKVAADSNINDASEPAKILTADVQAEPPENDKRLIIEPKEQASALNTLTKIQDNTKGELSNSSPEPLTSITQQTQETQPQEEKNLADQILEKKDITVNEPVNDFIWKDNGVVQPINENDNLVGVKDKDLFNKIANTATNNAGSNQMKEPTSANPSVSEEPASNTTITEEPVSNTSTPKEPDNFASEEPDVLLSTAKGNAFGLNVINKTFLRKNTDGSTIKYKRSSTDGSDPQPFAPGAAIPPQNILNKSVANKNITQSVASTPITEEPTANVAPSPITEEPAANTPPAPITEEPVAAMQENEGGDSLISNESNAQFQGTTAEPTITSQTVTPSPISEEPAATATTTTASFEPDNIQPMSTTADMTSIGEEPISGLGGNKLSSVTPTRVLPSKPTRSASENTLVQRESRINRNESNQSTLKTMSNAFENNPPNEQVTGNKMDYENIYNEVIDNEVVPLNMSKNISQGISGLTQQMSKSANSNTLDINNIMTQMQQIGGTGAAPSMMPGPAPQKDEKLPGIPDSEIRDPAYMQRIKAWERIRGGVTFFNY